MNMLLVSTTKSACSGCGGNVLHPQTVTECVHCGERFTGVMMLADTGKAFHHTLPHIAPIDAPEVNTRALTWYRPFNARLDYELSTDELEAHALVVGA